jgi:arylsulfatase A-like enzyme
MELLRRAVPAIVLLWAVFLVAQLAGMAFTTGFWGDVQLGPLTKAWLFTREAVFGAFVAIAAGLSATALGAPRVPRAARLAGDLALATLIVVLLVVSWAQYSLFGDFLGIEAVRMALADFALLLQHARAFARDQLAYGVPVLALGVAAVAFGLERARVPRAGQPRVGALAVLVGALLAASLFSALAGGMLRHEHVPRSAAITDLRALEFLRAAQRAGPLSYLRNDLVTALHGQVPPLARAPEVYERRPLVPLETWLGQARGGANRRSVVVLVVESMRADTLRAFGGRWEAMPAIDSIAADAARFRDAYSQSSHSNYADTSLAGSQYPMRSRRVHHFPEQPGYPRVLLQDLLAPLGYRCALFSSQNEGWGGMHHFAGSPGFERVVHAGNFGGALREELDDVAARGYAAGYSEYNDSMLEENRAGKIDDAVTVRLAREWLAGVPRDTPFYLSMNLQNSHLPYHVPAGFTRRFFTEQGEALAALESGRVTQLTIEQIYRAYLDSLAYIDAQVAGLIADLKAQRRWDETVFVVTADTASSFYAQGIDSADGKVVRILGNGGTLLEEVVHVPLFVRVPGEPARDLTHRVQQVDVLPGVLRALGLPPHPGAQGIDPFVPVPSDRRPVFLVAQTPAAMQYAVLLGPWKLTFDAQLDRWLLEDLRPGATIDPALAARLLPRLQLELSAWVGEQLAYYEDPEAWTRTYPPMRRLDHGPSP